METLEINKVEIRNLQKEDYDQLASSFTRVYACLLYTSDAADE